MDRFKAIWLHCIIATFAGLMLAWSNLYAPWSASVSDALGRALYWPERPALEARGIIYSFSSWVVERKNLRQRMVDLESENLAMRKRLAELAHPVPPNYGVLVGGRVTLRYPEVWWREVRVDRGTKDGVRPGMPALADGYLIGRVVRAESTYCWVELLTSSQLMMASVVEETRDLGVIRGDDMGNVWLQFIPEEKPIKKDMKLSTALVDEFIPPGIPVGTVLSAGTSSGGFTPYRVVLGAHLTQLYTLEIMVVDMVKR